MSTDSPRRRARKSRRGGFWSAFLQSALSLGMWVFIGMGLCLGWILSALPDIDAIRQPPPSTSVTLTDIKGDIITTRGLSYGDSVSLKELPTYVPEAVMALEDRRFYRHFGLDLWGLFRAAMANIHAGRVVQGGSSITQQLAKNLFLSPERTMSRKLQEAVLALYLEMELSKDEILELYLNRVYFGAGTHGVDAAARRYFGKPATDVTLGEAALLAGLIKAPSRYAPTANRTGALERVPFVLRQMEAAGYITKEQRLTARTQEPRLLPAATPGVHYFVDWIVEELPGHIGRHSEDVTVETTIDLHLQRKAEAILTEIMAERANEEKASEAALVVIDMDGSVRAMVGGRSYTKSQFNRAAQAHRQPGSAFKPFVYLAALESGFTPDTVTRDERVRVGSWSPSNYNSRYEGKVSLTEALAKSLNGATVRIAETIGRRSVIEVAQRLGIYSPLPNVPSLPLGVAEVSLIELTGAYVPFANGGRRVIPHGITRISTLHGDTLYRREEWSLGQVIAPGPLSDINSMLMAVVGQGTGQNARVEGRPTAGKTGTSQNYRDAWFIGYSGQLAAGIWVGNDNNASMARVTGGKLPAHIFRRFMTAALEDKPITGVPGSPVWPVVEPLARDRVGELLLDLDGIEAN